MKLITLIALIALIALATMACTLSAADKPADPLAGAFFPPDVILMAHEQLGLTQAQQDAFHAQMEKVQQRTNELRVKLEAETAALSALANQPRIDEAALGRQLDKVLDVEREVKHLHVGLVAGIKNQLTAEQQAKLREITKNGGAQLAEDARKRLTEKVERVKAGAQKMAEGGSDPSDILKAMEEKFKPLMETGRAAQAEAELDRVLEQLTQGAK